MARGVDTALYIEEVFATEHGEAVHNDRFGLHFGPSGLTLTVGSGVICQI